MPAVTENECHNCLRQISHLIDLNCGHKLCEDIVKIHNIQINQLWHITIIKPKVGGTHMQYGRVIATSNQVARI